MCIHESPIFPAEQNNYFFLHPRERHKLLPLQEFTCCLRGISATLSFSQHFCMAFLDTFSATRLIQSLLHGKTHSLAPPAALTPLTPKHPLKNNYHSTDSKWWVNFLGSPLPSLNGQRTQGPTGGKVATKDFSRGSSTQLLLIDSSKGKNSPFLPRLSCSLFL